jgi:hypothetical protein
MQRNAAEKGKKRNFEIQDRIRPAEARQILHTEIKALRQAAEATDDAATLVTLDFLEDALGDPFLLLGITLQASAGFAAARSLSAQAWMQQVLERHASNHRTLETIWHALADFRLNGNWPWPGQGDVNPQHSPAFGWTLPRKGDGNASPRHYDPRC